MIFKSLGSVKKNRSRFMSIMSSSPYHQFPFLPRMGNGKEGQGWAEAGGMGVQG